MGDVLLKLHQVLDCATRTLCYGLFTCREFRAQGSSLFLDKGLRDLTSKNNGIKWMCSWEMPTSITVESFNQLSRQQQTPLARWFIMLLNSRFYRSQTSLDPAHFQPLLVTALWTLKCKTSSHGQQVVQRSSSLGLGCFSRLTSRTCVDVCWCTLSAPKGLKWSTAVNTTIV